VAVSPGKKLAEEVKGYACRRLDRMEQPSVKQSLIAPAGFERAHALRLGTTRHRGYHDTLLKAIHLPPFSRTPSFFPVGARAVVQSVSVPLFDGEPAASSPGNNAASKPQ
jgi:hypothetical protein